MLRPRRPGTEMHLLCRRSLLLSRLLLQAVSLHTLHRVADDVRLLLPQTDAVHPVFLLAAQCRQLLPQTDAVLFLAGELSILPLSAGQRPRGILGLQVNPADLDSPTAFHTR